MWSTALVGNTMLSHFTKFSDEGSDVALGTQGGVIERAKTSSQTISLENSHFSTSDHAQRVVGALSSSPRMRVLAAEPMRIGSEGDLSVIFVKISNLLLVSMSPKGAFPVIISASTHPTPHQSTGKL